MEYPEHYCNQIQRWMNNENKNVNELLLLYLL